MQRLLFICSANKLRSPTAEQVFSTYPDIEARSAGLNHDAADPLSPEHFEDIDIVFVMEKAHRNKLTKKFRAHLKSARVICLNIPDDFEFMQQSSSLSLRHASRPICDRSPVTAMSDPEIRRTDESADHF